MVGPKNSESKNSCCAIEKLEPKPRYYRAPEAALEEREKKANIIVQAAAAEKSLNHNRTGPPQTLEIQKIHSKTVVEHKFY